MKATVERPVPTPDPEDTACVGCRWGFRRVCRVTDDAERDVDGEGWKPTTVRNVESYLCTNPVMLDGGDRSVAVMGVLHCDLREDPPRPRAA